MAPPGTSAAAHAREGAPLALPVLLADRQGVAFVATARGAESLRVPRRYWGTEVGVVPIPASDEEIRATDLGAPLDAGSWPSVVPRPDLLAPALSRLVSGEHVELSLQPGRDGLKATLITTHGEEQPFPIAPKDSLGFLAAVFHYVPTGVVRTGQGKPARVLLSVRPAVRRHEYRLRLAAVVASPPPATLPDMGLSPSLLELLLEGLERPAGLLLVSGGPSSGRSTMLELLASTLAARGHKGGRIGATRAGAKPDLTWLADALSDWPFPESLHAAAPDFVLIDRLEGPPDLVMAARLAASGSLVLAGAPASEPEALARTVARDLEGGSGPTVPLAILAQARVRTVCRQCITWRTIPTAQAERLGFQRRDLEEMEKKGGLIVPNGKGCHDCAGTGAAGLTGVFEYLGPEAGPGSLPRMREDGWRKVWQGIACHEDVAALPGAHRPMRTLREIIVHAGLGPGALEGSDADAARPGAAAQESRARGPAARHAAESAPAGAARVGSNIETVARLFTRARSGRPAEPEALADLAREIAARAATDEPLDRLLPRGSGFHLGRHSVNSALIACRLARFLGLEADLPGLARLALLHDAGLLLAGVDPQAELPGVPSEEPLDPQGSRLAPAPVLELLGVEGAAMEETIRQVQSLLASESASSSSAARPDTRVQAVALASLVDLQYHAPDGDRPADLHDVTSVVMERHGRRFSPALFRALLRALPIFPIGTLVELSSGDLARVVSLNEDNHFRPRVEIVTGGETLSERRVVDLARAPFLHIRHRVSGATVDAVGGAVRADARR